MSDETIAAQRATDPTSAVSEWDADFRPNLSTYLDDVLIETAVEYGRPLELPPKPVGYYKAFVDASGGGAHGDACTIAIAHKEDELFFVDLVRGTPGPFDPYVVTKQYAELCKQYRVTIVTRDRWGKEWVQSTWRGTGCAYVQSSLAKSHIYLEVIPLFFRGRIRLPGHPKLLRKLRLLHLQRHGGGRQSIDHPRGDHDDFANAVCGVLRGLSDHYGYRLDVFDPNFRDEDAPPQPARQGPELSDVPLYNGDMAAYFSTADIC